MGSPTYQQLIDLLAEAESISSHPQCVLSTAEILTTNFSHLFPHIKIGRPGRFLETVRRINSPLTKAVWTGEVTKQTYLKRSWIPRTRNTSSEQGT